MIRNRIQSATRLSIAAIAVAVMAIGVATALPADAAGLRNCVDIPSSQAGRVGCYELVWADGVQHRMTFSNQGFDGATPKALDPFYVLAPQTDMPQGAPPEHVSPRPRRPRRARREPRRLQRQAAGLLRPVQRPRHHQRRVRPLVDVRRRPGPAPVRHDGQRPAPDVERRHRGGRGRRARRAWSTSVPTP